MIFPILLGFAPFEKAPLTWLLLLGLTISFAQTQPLNQYSYGSLESIMTDPQFIITQGHIYKKYLEVKQVDTPLVSVPLKTLGEVAFQDKEFLQQAPKMEWKGDGVSISSWKKSLADYQSVLNLYPAQKLGISALNHPWFSVLTYQFTHDGWLHLIGNMLLLYLVGGFLEQKGHGRAMVVTFFSGGALAALSYSWILGLKTAPLIGASGSVCALIGLFLVLFAKEKTNVLYFILPFEGYFGRAQWKTLYWAPWLFILEDVSGWLARPMWIDGGVNHFVHLAGMVSGVIVGFMLLIYIKYFKNKQSNLNSLVMY